MGVPRAFGRWLWVLMLWFTPQLSLQDLGRPSVWFGALFLLAGQGFVFFFVSVSLKPFKTQLKVELLFLEGIERVLAEGLEVQE